MGKGLIVIILISSFFLMASPVLAGGMVSRAGGEQIGLPPETLVKVSNIIRTKGKGEAFYPLVDFFSRIVSHYIEPGDKKSGPGWGVPEGHNIGNAPELHVIGKYLDRSGRGKGEPVVDLLKRIEKHEKGKVK